MRMDKLTREYVLQYRAMEERAAQQYPPMPEMASVTRTEASADGAVPPLTVYTPRMDTPRKLPAVVYYHGGGWAWSSAAVYDPVLRRIADAVPAVVIAPDYRLAPEHPFPAAVDDAWAALKWTVAHADKLGIDSTNVFVAGDSAGGNLAAVVALRAVREGGPALRGQALVYPSVDIAATGNGSLERFREGYLLTAPFMEGFRDFYIPDEKQRADPYASPLRAESFTGLPPTLIVAAGCDPLLDQGKAYADKLRSAGVKVAYTLIPHVFHGYLHRIYTVPPVAPQAEQTIRDLVGFVKEEVKKSQ
jgi:acetyl esterase